MGREVKIIVKENHSFSFYFVFYVISNILILIFYFLEILKSDFRGGGGVVVLAFEPAGGRSRVTKLSCFYIALLC